MSRTTRDTANWRTGTLPMTVCGPSGGGKTTTARCLHDMYPGPSIIFNLDHEPDFGTVVESVDGLKAALSNGAERIDVRPPVESVREPDLFEEVIRFLLEIGNHLRGSDTFCQIIMDEAQDLQERWVAVALKRLRKRNIKPVAMTQDPISLPKRHRTIADFNCWLSPPPADMAKNLERNTAYPVDLLRELPDFDMLVLGAGWEAVTRFRAPERYVA